MLFIERTLRWQRGLLLVALLLVLAWGFWRATFDVFMGMAGERPVFGFRLGSFGDWALPLPSRVAGLPRARPTKAR